MDLSCMGIVVEGNDPRVICVYNAITCATERSQDDEINCLKEGISIFKALPRRMEAVKRAVPAYQHRATEPPCPIMIDDADVDLANPEILTVQEDQDGDEDDDVEIYL